MGKEKPTFCIEDPEEGSVVFNPEDYADYEYSPDGDWLTIYFDDAEGTPFGEEHAPQKRVYWIRYE